MLAYIIVVFGALIYGVGAPSRSGRRGELAIQLTWIGLLIISIGSIMAGLAEGILRGAIVFIVGFIMANIINGIKK